MAPSLKSGMSWPFECHFCFVQNQSLAALSLLQVIRWPRLYSHTMPASSFTWTIRLGWSADRHILNPTAARVRAVHRGLGGIEETWHPSTRAWNLKNLLSLQILNFQNPRPCKRHLHTPKTSELLHMVYLLHPCVLCWARCWCKWHQMMQVVGSLVWDTDMKYIETQKNNILQLPTSWHFAYWHTIIWRFSVAMECVLLLYHWHQHIPTMPPKFFSHTKSAASAGNSARVLLWNHYGSIRRCNQCGWPGTASGGAFFRDGTRTLPRLAKHGSLSLCRTSSTIINKYRCKFRFQGIVPEAKERQKINVLQFHSCGQKGDCLLLVQFDIFCLCRKTWKSRCRASRVTVLAAQLAIEQSTCSNLGCTWMDSMDRLVSVVSPFAFSTLQLLPLLQTWL